MRSPGFLLSQTMLSQIRFISLWCTRLFSKIFLFRNGFSSYKKWISSTLLSKPKCFLKLLYQSILHQQRCDQMVSKFKIHQFGWYKVISTSVMFYFFPYFNDNKNLFICLSLATYLSFKYEVPVFLLNH